MSVGGKSTCENTATDVFFIYECMKLFDLRCSETKVGSMYALKGALFQRTVVLKLFDSTKSPLKLEMSTY